MPKIETIETKDLADQFGLGWVYWHSLGSKLVALPFHLVEVLPFEERRLLDDGRVTCAPNGAYREVYESKQRAADACLEEAQTDLREAIGKATRWHDRCARELKWYRAWRLWPLFHRKALKEQCRLMQERIANFNDQLQTIPQRMTAYPMPDVVEHYGRLALGSTLWLLDWDAPGHGFPIVEFRVVAEQLDIWRHPALPSQGPCIFEYKIQPISETPRNYGELTVAMGEKGLDVRPRYGVTGFRTFESALAEREDRVRDLLATLQTVESEMADRQCEIEATRQGYRL